MRIGNITIKGISRRFYFIVSGVILCIILLVELWPSSAPPANPYTTPAFPPSLLSSPALQQGGWISNLISANGLFIPQQATDFTGVGYASHLGLPMQFAAFIFNPQTAQTARPDLVFQKDGYTFEPAEFLTPNVPVSLSTLTNSSSLPTQPLDLGFRSSATPVPNAAYEITGLLWWRSDLFSPQGTQAQGAPPLASPIIIVDSYRQLSDVELQAPTTQAATLDLNYEEGPLALDISNIEWSAGQQLRVCIQVTNISNQTQPMWSGVGSMTADIGQGAETGTADPNSALSTTGQLLPYQSVAGYILFGASVADASQPLTLQMPTLGTQTSYQGSFSGQGQDSLIINVPQSAITAASSVQSSSVNCGAADSGASSSSAGSSGSSSGNGSTALGFGF